jgi:hypothetical protein
MAAFELALALGARRLVNAVAFVPGCRAISLSNIRKRISPIALSVLLSSKSDAASIVNIRYTTGGSVGKEKVG